MSRYIVKRLLYMIPMLFCVILMIFLIMSLTPGDPASNVLPLTTPQDVKDAFNERVGFSGSLLTRFGNYMHGLLTGNVLSYTTQENVFTELATRFPLTIRVGTWAFCISAVIGVSLGILSAIKQYSFLDTTVTIFAVTFASVPSFFVAVLMILFFAVYKGWLPSFGIEGFTSYIMPVATLVLANIPILSRMTRSSMLDAMTQDYIRTARANGIREGSVKYRHALKNSLIPVITLVALQVRSMVGGSLLAEQVFSIAGMGRLIMTSVMNKDYLTVQATTFVISLFVVICNFLLDIAYGIVDPRIRLSAGKRK